MRSRQLQGGTEPVDYYIFHKALGLLRGRCCALRRGWPCDYRCSARYWLSCACSLRFCKMGRDAPASGTWPIYTNRLMVDGIYRDGQPGENRPALEPGETI